MSQHLSLPKDKIRFLLLEGVHQNAIDTLNAAGYTNIDYRKTALEGDLLLYPSDAADARQCVELGGLLIIDKR